MKYNLVIVIPNIILDTTNNNSVKITVYKRIFAVFLEIISYDYLFSKRGRIIKHLVLYLINSFKLLYFNVSILTSQILHIPNN